MITCSPLPCRHAGIPVWWHLTSLHRPPLPLDAMQHAADAAHVLLRVTVEAYMLLSPGALPRQSV